MSDDEIKVRKLAESLSFSTDDDVLEQCLETSGDVVAETSSPSESERTSVGHRSDDDYNALLDVYERPRRDASDGVLGGVSLAIKDNMAVSGLSMTAGLEDVSYVPAEDAVVVRRLLEAGGEIVGKSNMDALAIGPGGAWSEIAQVANPTYPGCYPGGSSSGSAAAVAAGLVDAALGSDSGGSIRKPAAYCGVVGMKPTNGAVPTHGFVPLAPSLDAIGPIARDVETAANVLETIAGYHPRDPGSSHVEFDSLGTRIDDAPSPTIGLPDAYFERSVDAVTAVLRSTMDRLDERYDVRFREVSVDDDAIADVYSLVLGAEFAWTLRQSGVRRDVGGWYGEAVRELYGEVADVGFNDHITLRQLPAAFVDAETDGGAYTRAREEMIEHETRLTELFRDVDVLLTPTIPRFPPSIDTDLDESEHDRSSNLRGFNATGHPAITVPVGESDGRPVSAQIVAPQFEDGLALRTARMVETVAG